MKKILVSLLCFDMLIAILFSFGIHHSLFIMYSYIPLLLLNIFVLSFATRSRWRHLINFMLLLGIVLCLPEIIHKPQTYLETAGENQYRIVKYVTEPQGKMTLDYQIFEGSIATLGFIHNVNSGQISFNKQGFPTDGLQRKLGDGQQPHEMNEIKAFLSNK